MLSRNLALIVAAATVVLVVGEATVSQSNLTRPGCPEMCGKISVPYPFGFKEGCYYKDTSNDTDYHLTCESDKKHHNSSRLMYGNMEVLHIGLDGQLRILKYVSRACYEKDGTPTTRLKDEDTSLTTHRFTLSNTENVFGAIGCDTYAWFDGKRLGRNYSMGCLTVCDTLKDVDFRNCSGLGCCQMLIPDGVTDITVRAYSFYNHTEVNKFNPCSLAFVVAKDRLNFRRSNLTRRPHKTPLVPAVLDWMIGAESCSKAQANDSKFLCKGNSTCDDSWQGAGYRCKCLPGYLGNPYLIHGCQDINECEHNPCGENAKCNNYNGGYNCTCPKGFQGNGTMTDRCIQDNKTQRWSKVFRITIGVGGGIIVLLVVAFWLYLQHEHKQLKEMRRSFFRQNGGHLLVEKLTRRDRSINMITIFTIEELKKATNNYDESKIIGRGGFGMVYKGIISSPNGQLVVAIKRSLKVDSTQNEQFVNEVIVLSQLNHKNVVKLLGCCLEEEVPLLVYEYIENGTLYDHLHDESRVSLFTNWEIRLKIAVEIAEVLAYLHTSISMPIIHRDIKSMNILLDDNYTAKVSDFGTSRLVPMDQDQNATMVQGTYGYLDPEYMQIGQLNEKSDVYSFGVVLLELLTREKAVSYVRPENERCLAIYFLRKLKEDHLFEILDDKMLMDDRAIKQVKEVANIARRCLKLKGEDRPSMKQVARELDEIRGNGSHPWAHNKGLLQEETEYLLNETQAYNDEFGTNSTKGSSSTQTSLLQLVPLDGGR